jgi:hypothetical protein
LKEAFVLKDFYYSFLIEKYQIVILVAKQCPNEGDDLKIVLAD